MTARTVALPAFAALAVAGVLAIQVTNGGGGFEPNRAADPCAPRQVRAVADGIDGVAEQLVLLGLDGAACRLGSTREGLVLELAEDRTPDDVRVEALRAGLLDAVDRLDEEGRLPRASVLADEAIDRADLNRLVEIGLRAIPDALIDNRLKTDNVLRRAIQDLDLGQLLVSLNDPAELNELVEDAVTEAAKDELLAGLPGLL